MPIKSLRLSNFRCFKYVECIFGDGPLLFYGRNGSGKTSLLESIYLAAFGKSFRTTKTTSLIGQYGDFFEVSVGLSSPPTEIVVKKDKNGKIVFLINNKKTHAKSLLEHLKVNLLDSRMFFYTSSSPDFRRKNLDRSLFLVSPNYRSAWFDFYKALRQRNAGLKNNNPTEAASWNEPLNSFGSVLNEYRARFIQEAEQTLVDLVKKSPNDEFLASLKNLKIKYIPGFKGNSLLESLDNAMASDLLKRTTSEGPHRADVDLTLKDAPVKDLFSRGEEKILSILWGLAISETLNKSYDIHPITILDDISSEVDKMHVISLIEVISKTKNQFIFSNISDPFNSKIRSLNNLKKFHVEQFQ